jgi:hypothetical protein
MFGCMAKADTQIKTQLDTRLDARLGGMENRLTEKISQATTQTNKVTIKAAGEVKNSVETNSISNVGLTGPYLALIVLGLALLSATTYLVTRYFRCKLTKWAEKRSNGGS